MAERPEEPRRQAEEPPHAEEEATRGPAGFSLGSAAAGTIQYALGFGMGFALGRVLEPEGVQLQQEAWARRTIRDLEPDIAAQVAAEGIETPFSLPGEAEGHGFNADRFEAMVAALRVAPGQGELLRMLRRRTIDPDAFRHGLRKGKLEHRWDEPLQDLEHDRLDPAAVAVAIQRGIMEDPGFLLVPPDFAGSNVPAPPLSPLNALHEARDQGESAERLAVRTRIVGLPPGPGELLQLVNRGVINEAAYRLGIAEGNTRNEWAAPLLHLRRRLLTPHEYAELHLRGWITPHAMTQGAALSGMEAPDTQHLFELLGRPITARAVLTGEARGGVYGEGHGHIPEAYLRALEQGSLRPEWYSLAYANRYTYPSAFVLRALVQAHDLTEAQGHEILLKEGWEPHLAEQVAHRWAAGGAGHADPHVAKAQSQLWTTLHRSYLNEETDAPQAHELLGALGVAGEAQAHVLALWDHERTVTRRTLTPSQVKKAYTEGTFTQAEAVARLERQGMDEADALIYLGE